MDFYHFQGSPRQINSSQWLHNNIYHLLNLYLAGKVEFIRDFKFQPNINAAAPRSFRVCENCVLWRMNIEGVQLSISAFFPCLNSLLFGFIVF